MAVVVVVVVVVVFVGNCGFVFESFGPEIEEVGDAIDRHGSAICQHGLTMSYQCKDELKCRESNKRQKGKVLFDILYVIIFDAPPEKKEAHE